MGNKAPEWNGYCNFDSSRVKRLNIIICPHNSHEPYILTKKINKLKNYADSWSILPSFCLLSHVITLKTLFRFDFDDVCDKSENCLEWVGPVRKQDPMFWRTKNCVFFFFFFLVFHSTIRKVSQTCFFSVEGMWDPLFGYLFYFKVGVWMKDLFKLIILILWIYVGIHIMLNK